MLKLFSGSSNLEFSKNVANHLNIELSEINISKFPDGEIKLNVVNNVRQADCFIIQSTCRNNILNTSVNDNIMELFIMIDALKRGSAKTVNVIMPYYGYQRQDRKDYSRAPISASVISRCLESLNVNRVIVYDLHANQISGFFSNLCPLDNLYSESYFINYIKKNIMAEYFDKNDTVIIAPDAGAMKCNYRVSLKLKCASGSIFKNRNKDGVIDNMLLMGDVNNKNIIMIDDMIDTAGTICEASKLLKNKGAKQIFVFATHGLFSKNAIERINNSNIDKVIITNTVENSLIKNERKFDVIDVSWLCAESIKRLIEGKSISCLYDNLDNFNLDSK